MMNMEEMNVAGLPLQFPRPSTGNQLPTLAEWNQRYIEYVLAFTKGKKTAAARILGINRRTLYRRKKAKNGVIDNAHMMDEMGTSLEVPAGHQVQ